MHIGFRTSGGRGEYEVVGSHAGYTAASLEGWSFFMKWPDGLVRDTGLWLDPGDSGKPRLRSVLPAQIQIGRIVGPMLMLPDSTRSFKQTPSSWPILKAKEYSLLQVGFGPDTEFAPAADRVTFVPSWIEVANVGDRDAIGVEIRWNRIVALYAAVDALPFGLAALVRSHRDFLASGETVNSSLMKIVNDLCKQLETTPGSGYIAGYDPLPALEALAGLYADSSEPTLPPPDELSEDEPEISARAAEEWRLAKSRGAAGKKFSQKVRSAYGHRCVFCGAIYGGLDGIRSGIDAAHILAWSKHDLDCVSNGLALCKLHHWAFDAGVMTLEFRDGTYYVRHTGLTEKLDQHSQEMLGTDQAPVPLERLPAHEADWPSPKYLELLYADLGVSFCAS